jgi:uncharacterized iron-regulated protein
MNRKDKVRARLGVALLAGVTLLQGCALSSKPALPKQASIEHVARPATTDFAALVAEADVIYFPSDRAASGARSEPAALLVEALQNRAQPFAVGWDMISASQQPVLDQIETNSGPAREGLIGQLELVASGRAREHCRALLRESSPVAIHHLALRCPAELLARIASGTRLGPEEEKFLPRGYATPAQGFESYVERLASPQTGDPRLAQSYRAELVRQQFTAEGIVHYLRSAEPGKKLLIFAAGQDLENGHGVPFYVAQKVEARQLVLGSPATTTRPKLLTSRDRTGNGRRFQIVDSAPRAVGN